MSVCEVSLTVRTGPVNFQGRYYGSTISVGIGEDVELAIGGGQFWSDVGALTDLGGESSVDENRIGGRFLLTGSATPTTPPTHSGAARIVRLRLRPLSLAERGLFDRPTVSTRELLGGAKPTITGIATVKLSDYTEESHDFGQRAYVELS